jgi:hypothetical protein
LQSPEVAGVPLPQCHGPTVTEPDTLLMRPTDADRVVLSVEPPVKCLEPDSPLSTEPLIGPQTPDYKLPLSPPYKMDRHANLRASAESLDRLLAEEEAKTSAAEAPSLHEQQQQHEQHEQQRQQASYPFNNIFTFQEPECPLQSAQDRDEPSNLMSASQSPELETAHQPGPLRTYVNWPVKEGERVEFSSAQADAGAAP